MAQKSADDEFGYDREQTMVEQPKKAGDYLRKKREEQKVPLESVARVTRITLSNLQALEKDELQDLATSLQKIRKIGSRFE